jgi:hypothetical protein
MGSSRLCGCCGLLFEKRTCWARRLSFERRTVDMQVRWAIISQSSGDEKEEEEGRVLLHVRKLLGS